LLDEPAAGVPRGESAELFAVVSGLPSDISVLFIEHDMNFVFRFASRIIVMVGGTILLEGTPREIAADPRVREVYLGQSRHAAAAAASARRSLLGWAGAREMSLAHCLGKPHSCVARRTLGPQRGLCTAPARGRTPRHHGQSAVRWRAAAAGARARADDQSDTT